MLQSITEAVPYKVIKSIHQVQAMNCSEKKALDSVCRNDISCGFGTWTEYERSQNIKPNHSQTGKVILYKNMITAIKRKLIQHEININKSQLS